MKNKINNFFNEYTHNLSKSLSEVDLKKLSNAANKINQKIKNNKTIYVCGNGGSAAIANHYICDFLKYFREKTRKKSKIISLSNNVETITAISNDISYEKIFSYQAESLCEKGDLIIIISSSGNSKNIIELLKFAKKNKVFTIGFSGFKGGFLKKNCDISVHVEADNYGISEDSHHILMHLILQYLIKSLNIKKKLK